MQAPGLTEFISFICTTAIWGQSCFLGHLTLHSLSSFVITTEGGSKITVWELPFTVGGQKSLMVVTFLFINMAGDIFISQKIEVEIISMIQAKECQEMPEAETNQEEIFSGIF